MASATNEIDDVRRQMAQIRRELHEDVQGMVAGAEAVADWHRYLRLYPWAFVGAAFGLGFLIAPRRRGPSVAQQVATAMPEQVKAAVQEAKEEIKAPTKGEKRAGIAGLVFGTLGPIAVKAAQNYAMHFVQKWIADQAAAGHDPLAFLQNVPGMPPMGGRQPGPGQPGGPGHPPGTGHAPGGPSRSTPPRM